MTADPGTAAASSMQDAVARLLRPRSVAIVGASPTPGSPGADVLANLLRFGFAGQIYLVNPKRSEIAGRACLRSVDELPMGVDCAILAIPSAGVVEAVSACARRGVSSLVIFSSGFAEAGPEGRVLQDEVARIARDHSMAVEGPNCMGLINYVDAIPLAFSAVFPVPLEKRDGVAVLTQSGGIAVVLRTALQAREIRTSFSISTGNEAVTAVEDFLEYLLHDGATRAIAMVVEQFRHPRRFLELARQAREAGKPIVLLHPGRSAAARASAQTHTGALAGDYAVMRTLVAHEGVAVVDTLEELIDLSELLLRCPTMRPGGAALITDSGVFKALALDFSESISLDLPELSPATEAALRAVMPDFILPTNPLDITAQALIDPELYRKTMGPLLVDERYSSLVIASILPNPEVSRRKVPPIIHALEQLRPGKPVIFAALGEDVEVPAELISGLRSQGVPLFRSPERALRALARLSDFAAPRPPRRSHTAIMRRTTLPTGVVPEYRSKQILAEAGIPVPRGEVVRDLPAAMEAASRIGYPVALKAQSVSLSHKSDCGAVLLRIGDAEALADGWRQLHANVARAHPQLALDGVLVEAMAKPGLELILGARNDRDWGSVLMIGLGGIWAEALQDVRLLPPDLAPEAIAPELRRLKGAALLCGVRGAAALDVEALAELASRVAAFVLTAPEVVEIDINPVLLYPRGEGAMAVDALIVTR